MLGVEESQLTDAVTFGFSEWNLDAMGGYEPLHRFTVTQRNLFEKLQPMTGAPAALRVAYPEENGCLWSSTLLKRSRQLMRSRRDIMRKK